MPSSIRVHLLIDELHSEQKEYFPFTNYKRMAANSLITIKTESGEWEREVEVDDPVFSPLIPDLPDVGEVTLYGSVAEIVLEEWEAYEALLTYMESIRRTTVLASTLLSMENPLPPSQYKRNFESQSMSNLLRGISDVAIGSYKYSRLVYLDEVSRLSNLINFPKYWELCVGVREKSPEIERRRHIPIMGRQYMELGLSFGVKRGYTNVNSPESILLLNLGMWIDKLAEEGHPVDPWWEVYWVLARNLLIRSWDATRTNQGGLDWTNVLWGDMIPLMSTYYIPGMSEKVLKQDGNTGKVAAILAGHGSYLDKVGKGPNVHITNSVLFVTVASFPEFYRRLLLSFPEDVDPVALGLEPVLRLKSTGVKVWQAEGTTAMPMKTHYLPIVNTVPWIHYNSLLLASLNEKRKENSYHNGTSIAGTVVLREDQYPSVVTMMTKGLGTKAMSRILLSLFHYLEREGENSRVEAFAVLIEEAIEDESVPSSFSHLPRLVH